jgi:hypothetical protein
MTRSSVARIGALAGAYRAKASIGNGASGFAAPAVGCHRASLAGTLSAGADCVGDQNVSGGAA